MPKPSVETLRLLAPNGQYLENIDFYEDQMAIINMINYNTSQILKSSASSNFDLLGTDIPSIDVEGMTLGDVVMTNVLVVLGSGTITLA